MRTRMAARLHLATAQAEHSAYNLLMAAGAPKTRRPRRSATAQTVFEMLVVTIVSSGFGFALSWTMDWYYWQRDMLGYGSITMYLQQATESWILGTGTGIILAVVLVYGLLRLHQSRGERMEAELLALREHVHEICGEPCAYCEHCCGGDERDG